MNEEFCPNGHKMKTIPAGISKSTNRPYNAFTVCEDREHNWKPERKTTGYVAQHTVKLEDMRAANIKVAQERKEESITKFNALNAAINLVCHHDYYKYLTGEAEILEKVLELQKKFINHNNQPFQN